MDKKSRRLKRAKRIRKTIRRLGINRLSVFRTPRHIYAQITTADGAKVLAASSSLDRTMRMDEKSMGNVEGARQVGISIAEKALAIGITAVAFDRAGYKYHGRVKALAEAAREKGLRF